MNKINAIQKVQLKIWQQFREDGCFGQAASLAYTTLLSLVPLLTVGFSVLAAFPLYRNLSEKIQTLIFSHIVATSAQTIQDYFLTFIKQTSQLSILGMISLLATAVLLVFSMEQAFNKIWRIEKNRNGVTAFLLYWAVITLIPLAIASLVALSNYVGNLAWLSNLHLHFIATIVATIIPYLATFIAFALLYLALPNCKVPIRSALLAALVATILFELARKAFTLYILSFASYALIYGALAAVPIFLVWLYISWVVILFGAVVSHVLAQD